MNCLKLMRADFAVEKDFVEVVKRRAEAEQKAVLIGKKAGNLSTDREYVLNLTLAALDEQLALIVEKAPASGEAAFKLLKSDLTKEKGTRQTDNTGRSESGQCVCILRGGV